MLSITSLGTWYLKYAEMKRLLFLGESDHPVFYCKLPAHFSVACVEAFKC